MAEAGDPNLTDFLAMVAEYDTREAELAQAIGVFSMRFAHLEGHLDWANTILLGTTEGRGRVLMAAIQSVSTRLNVLSALIVGIKMEEPVRTRLRECAKEIDRLNTYRNQLLHNRWSGWNGKAFSKIWTKTGRRGAKWQHRMYTEDEVRAEAEKCTACAVTLMESVKVYQDQHTE